VKIKNIVAAVAAVSMTAVAGVSYAANDVDSQIQQLQQQVKQLQAQINDLGDQQSQQSNSASSSTKSTQTASAKQGDNASQDDQAFVRTSSSWTQQMTNNQKRTGRDITVLKARKDNEIQGNSIYLGGKGEIAAAFVRASGGQADVSSNQTQIMMPFVDIVFTAAIGDWVTGFADLQVGDQFGTPATGQSSGSNAQNSNVTLPQAFFTVGNTDVMPLFATLGVKVVDFGDFRQENNIIPTLTEFGFMSQGGQVAAGADMDGIILVVTAMNGGGLAQTNAATDNNQAINNFAVNLGYEGEYGHLGIGYINGTGFNRNGGSPGFNDTLSADASTNESNGRVGAVALNAGLNAEVFQLNGDFVFTTQTVNGLNNSSAFNPTGSNINGYFPLTLLLGTGVQPGSANAVTGSAFNSGKTLLSWDLNGAFDLDVIEEHDLKIFGSYSQMYQESNNSIYQFVVGARVNLIETVWIGPSYQYFDGKLQGIELQSTNTILVDVTAYF
jgi:hypothetical protein